MKTSILIPYYNNSHTIEKAIESCLLQGEKHIKEIIVVDDGSKLDEFEFLAGLVNKFSLLSVFKNPSKGGNSARNYAFSLSKGDYIQWLDADDVLLSGKLDAQIDFFERNAEIDIVYSDWRYDFYNNKQFTHSEKHKGTQHVDYLHQLLIDNWQPCHNYLLKREIAQKLLDSGLWNTQTRVAQDREYFTNAAILGAKFGYISGEFAVYNRWGGNANVSTISFQERLVLNLEQVYSYKQKIKDSALFSQQQKKYYLSLLDTEILVSIYYNFKIKLPENIPFSHIIWKRIHWKMRFFIPFVYICKNIEFTFSKKK